MTYQLSLAMPTSPVPDLASYDAVLISTSGGKDSQACMDVLVAQAVEHGVRDRILAVHADLGAIEWPGARALANEHADFYGIPFTTVRRRDRHGNHPDLLTDIVNRGRWPDAANRYCTSGAKRGPIQVLMTAVTTRLREGGITDRPVRLLNVMGMRAEESAARRKRLPLSRNTRASNSRRTVDDFLPIHAFTEAETWATNRAAGTRSHWAYSEGMPRLSCRFCPLASRSATVLSAQLNPDLADAYVAAEQRMGHRFTRGWSIADAVAEARRRPRVLAAAGWSG